MKLAIFPQDFLSLKMIGRLFCSDFAQNIFRCICKKYSAFQSEKEALYMECKLMILAIWKSVMHLEHYELSTKCMCVCMNIPTDPFTNSELHNPTLEISKFRQSPDFEALKL